MSKKDNNLTPLGPQTKYMESFYRLISRADQDNPIMNQDVVRLSKPESTGPEGQTQVVITGVEDKGLTGQVCFTYRRIPLQEWGESLNQRLIVESAEVGDMFLSQVEMLLNLHKGSLKVIQMTDESRNLVEVGVYNGSPSGAEYVFEGSIVIERGIPYVPGSTRPQGRNGDIEFLGAVSSESFIRSPQLLNFLGLDVDSWKHPIQWLKFRLPNRQTIFIADKPVCEEIDWTTLYNHRLVYENGTGETPPGVDPIEQNISIPIRGHNYNVRLMKVMDPTHPELFRPGQELNNIIGALLNSEAYGRQFTWEELGMADNNSRFWGQQGPDLYKGLAPVASGHKQRVADPRTLKLRSLACSARHAWRPVLVLKN